jgi:hypothetical protein
MDVLLRIMDAKTALTDEHKVKTDAQLRETAIYMVKGIFHILRHTGCHHCEIRDGKTVSLDDAELMLLQYIQSKPSDAQRRKEYRAQRRNMLVKIMEKLDRIEARLGG